jgi:hypothetical protein
MRTTLHASIVYDNAFLVATLHTRNKTWTGIQRALRRAPRWGIQADDKLVRITRADMGCAYAAPGIFEVQTARGRTYTVVLS